MTQAAQFDAAINPQTDIAFGGALGHAITGVAAQALTIGALTTGVLTVETATGNLVLQSDNAADAITISGAADLITLGSPLTTTETIAKTGTANGGAVTVKVAEGGSPARLQRPARGRFTAAGRDRAARRRLLGRRARALIDSLRICARRAQIPKE